MNRIKTEISVVMGSLIDCKLEFSGIKKPKVLFERYLLIISESVFEWNKVLKWDERTDLKSP